jgi:hypothetical protein
MGYPDDDLRSGEAGRLDSALAGCLCFSACGLIVVAILAAQGLVYLWQTFWR